MPAPEFATTVDPNSGVTLAWVCMDDGVPKPCLFDQLGYAIGLGYKQCNPPGVKSEATTIAPDPVADTADVQTSVREVIAPEEPASEPQREERKTRRR